MKKKLPIKKSTSLRELAEHEVKHVKVTKTGYEARHSKKGATHKIEETKGGNGEPSVLATPLKKWKHKSVNGGYGEPKIPEEQATPEVAIDHSWHPPIPEGATHLQYSTSKASILCPIEYVNDFKGFRGTIRFGKIRYNEDFVSMMPGEEGNVTYWKDGRTAFAEGKDPASMRAKEKAAEDRAQRIAQGLPEHVANAFKAKTESRRVPPGPRPGDVPGKRQNGVLKPGAGGKTARVWEICEELLASLKRVPTKQDVFAIAVDKEGAKPGMVSTQHSYWRRFHGHVLAK